MSGGHSISPTAYAKFPNRNCAMKCRIFLASATAALLSLASAPASATGEPVPNPGWAGLEIAGPQAQSVEGSWRPSKVECPVLHNPDHQPSFAIWVGLGGAERVNKAGDTEPLIKAGTVTVCLAGIAFHQLVYEWIDRTGAHGETLGGVDANARISAKIEHVKDAKGKWTYRFDVTKNGESVEIPPVAISRDKGRATSSKEWIVERPHRAEWLGYGSPNCRDVLPDFGSITIHRGPGGTGTWKQWKITDDSSEPSSSPVLAAPATKPSDTDVTVIHKAKGSEHICSKVSISKSSSAAGQAR